MAGHSPDELGADAPRSARAGIVWQTATFLATKLLGFVSLLVLTHLLVPAEFGLVAAIIAFVSIIELGSDLGMKPTVIYEQQRGVTSRVRTALTLNIVLAGALAAIGVLLAPAVAGFFGQQQHTGLFRLAACNVALVGLANVHDATLLRDLSFERRIRTEIVRAVVQAVVSVALAAAGYGAASLIWGLLAGTVAWAAMQWSMTRIRPALRLDRAAVGSMLAYGGAASIDRILGILYTRLDSIVIARTLGEGALGIYTIAFRIPELLIESVALNLSMVAFPAFARKRVTDEQGMGAAALLLVRYQSLYALPLAAGMAILAVPLVDVLFSDEWATAAPVLSVVALMAALHAFEFPLGDLFKALGRQRLLIGMQLVVIPLSLVALIAFAPLGIVAVAWTRAATAALWLLLTVAFVVRLLGISPASLAAAAWPGLAAAIGVAAGAAALQVGWDGPSLATLLGGMLAGGVGGALALRVLAPAASAELRGQLARLLVRVRSAGA